MYQKKPFFTRNLEDSKKIAKTLAMGNKFVIWKD